MKLMKMKKSDLIREIDRLQKLLNAERTAREPASVPDLLSLSSGDADYVHRYADLYDLAPIGYVTLSETGVIEDINAAGSLLLGFERRKLVNAHFSFCMNSYYHKIFSDHLQCCREKGQSSTELQLRRQCGTPLDARLLSVAISPGEGEEFIYRTAIIDISRHKATEEALRKSEMKYRSLYNSMGQAFAFFAVIYDEKAPADYQILDVNPAFEKITGMSRSRAIGSRGSELFPDGRPLYLSVFSTVASSGKPTVIEAPSFLGMPTVRISVFSPAKGSFATVFEDITARKRTEQALRESEERYRRLVEHAPDAIAVHSENRFVYVNNAALALFGAVAREQLLGREVAEMVSPEFRASFRELMQEIDSGAPSPLREMLMVRVDGGPIGVEILGTPVTYGGRPAMQVMLRDVTERRQARQALLRTNDELEKRVAERTAQLAKTIDALQKEIHSRRETESALRDSEERYALAVQGAHDGIWDMNLETGEVYLSPRWKEMLGYGEADFSNGPVTWKSLIHPDDRARVEECIRAYLAGETPTYQVEHRLQHRDGGYRWILTRGSCLWNDDGRPYRMAGSHTDITDQKLAEEKILRLNHLYAMLSETNKAIVRSGSRVGLFNDVCDVAVDHGGFALAWIGILNRMTGEVEPAAAAGVGKELLPCVRISIRDEADDISPVVAALRGGTCRFCNFSHGDGLASAFADAGEQYGFNSAAAVPLRLEGGGTGVLALYAVEQGFFHQQMIELINEMAEDMSFALDRFDRERRHRQAERELQAETARRLQAVESLRERDQVLMHQSRLAAVGEMIGNIAHQWRQPLNTLGLYLQGMSVAWEVGDMDREQGEETIAKAMQVIFHMSQTIDDFRYFFKPDKEKATFRTREVVAKTVSLIEGSYKDQHILLEVTEEDDLELEGYPNEYSQVLLNILSNARDALIERQVKQPRVEVRIGAVDGRSVVTIKDNAGGIPEEILERIFDPYFTTKDPDRGTGVGLFISKTIIEKNMGGRLSARNCSDGAEFRIEV